MNKRRRGKQAQGGGPDELAPHEYITTPAGFAEMVLGQTLYPWQDEALAWFEDPRQRTQAALVTPNGAGKSSGVVAALALW